MSPSNQELTDEGGLLPLAESQVTRCCFDYGTSLLFNSERTNYELRIQTEFSVVTSAGTSAVEPDDLGTVAIVLTLVHLEVLDASCSSSGALSISFRNGTAIHIDPDPRYEAWTFNGPDGLLIVSLPGGGLAIWSEKGHPI